VSPPLSPIEETLPSGDELLAKLTRFGRVLHAAGMPVGIGRIIGAAQALSRVDVTRQEDVYWALSALLVSDHRQREVFTQVFAMFWREQRSPDDLLALLPGLRLPDQRPKALRRVAEAWTAGRAPGLAPSSPAPELEFDAALSYSERERLASKDFEQMSAREIEQAKRWIQELGVRLPKVTTRRLRRDASGDRLDLRSMLRASARTFGDGMPLCFRSRGERPAPLVVLCDVSGSMERYARIALHFMHALSARGTRRDVHSFVFGTRLTNITRSLRERDVDRALQRVGASVQDWTSGTRIGACLNEFNRRWARRVLGQNAVVILISDGLDSGDAAGISEAMERLHRSCRRLIWLNPLLRYAGFEPLAAGVRALLPHVDEHRPVHNLTSLFDLVQVLREQARRQGTPVLVRPAPAM
jgi:uncharacterized protein with von Willebrand factor type A (vWA) domain